MYKEFSKHTSLQLQENGVDQDPFVESRCHRDIDKQTEITQDKDKSAFCNFKTLLVTVSRDSNGPKLDW